MAEQSLPEIRMPQQCTMLRTDCENPCDGYIHVNIKAYDIKGQETSIYRGLCRFHLIDNSHINIHDRNESSQVNLNPIPNFRAACSQGSPLRPDPTKIPNEVNNCGAEEAQNGYSAPFPGELPNTCVTQNVYNYSERPDYSPERESPDYSPVRESPDFSRVRGTPVFSPVRESLDYSPVRKSPIFSPVPKSPDYRRVRESPDHSPVRESPTFSPVPESPDSSPVRESPDSSSVRESPTFSPVPETPDSSPVRESPTFSPVPESPDSSPVRESPDHSPVHESPDDSPVREPYANQETNIDNNLGEKFEENTTEDVNRTREEQVKLQSEDSAVEQLMSHNIQSPSKQQKTILLDGLDTPCGQTIQNIAPSDPIIICLDDEMDNEVVVISDSSSSEPPEKKCKSESDDDSDKSATKFSRK